MDGLGSRTTAPDAYDVDRVLVAFTLPHKGHDGIPGAPDDSCLRCNAERAFDRIVAAGVRTEEALGALNQAHNDLRDIAEASPNWMEPDAVAESERRKSRMARQAQMKVEAVLLAVVSPEPEHCHHPDCGRGKHDDGFHQFDR